MTINAIKHIRKRQRENRFTSLPLGIICLLSNESAILYGKQAKYLDEVLDEMDVQVKSTNVKVSMERCLTIATWINSCKK